MTIAIHHKSDCGTSRGRSHTMHLRRHRTLRRAGLHLGAAHRHAGGGQAVRLVVAFDRIRTVSSGGRSDRGRACGRSWMNTP
jgi:hypothetical protein